jgi:hypothetical protein
MPGRPRQCLSGVTYSEQPVVAHLATGFQRKVGGMRYARDTVRSLPTVNSLAATETTAPSI